LPDFVWRTSFHYAREDARLRGLVVGSAGMVDELAIATRFACSRGDAWRVVEFRRIACLELQNAFCTDGGAAGECGVTWRQAWRIASTWPFEAELQGQAMTGCCGRYPRRLKSTRRAARASRSLA
jgi:hypothetical protein